MSKRTKTPFGFTELPSVTFDHRPVEPEIRHVDPVFVAEKRKGTRIFRRSKQKVLQLSSNKLMMWLVSLLIKKTHKIMLNWIKDRLKEPSTLQGAAGLAGAVGYILNPEMLELIATTVVGLISLVQMAKKEKLVEKKDA